MAKPGRNGPCPCGSGNKYGKCCLAKEEAVAREAACQALGRSEGRPRYSFQKRGSWDWVSDRTFFGHLGPTLADVRRQRWRKRAVHARYKYVHFEGSRGERAALRRALRYQPLPHPKRGTVSMSHA
jgi:hypothetical protein